MEEETSENSQLLRTCSTCGESKAETEFHSGGWGRRKHCKACDTAGARERIIALRATDPVLAWAKSTYAQIKYRTKKAATPCAISVAMLVAKAPEVCPVLGIRLEYPVGYGKRGGHGAGSPSVDQIVAGAGYTDSNTIVVSNRANTIKRDATPDELLKIAHFYRDLEIQRNA